MSTRNDTESTSGSAESIASGRVDTLMQDMQASQVALYDLKALGLEIYLDDFGTGYSSLAYLKKFPIDALKIDRSFIRDIPGNTDDEAITRAFVALGQALRLKVVAEGVENAGMARQLLALGCDYGQGFVYAPALSAQEAEVYLNESYVDGAAPVKARG